MRVVSWNIRRARQNSPAWDYLTELGPDVAFLQEVGAIPSFISNDYSVISRPAATKSGNPPKFSTAVLIKSHQIETFYLKSEIPLVNDDLARFSGNLVAGRTDFAAFVSVHSPAWPLERERCDLYEVHGIKLKEDPDVWVTELLWAALREADLSKPWIVAGDLNSSETFDLTWGSGNKEILDRMQAAGFTEALRHKRGELTPTFRNPRDKKVIHQIDHLFVTSDLLRVLTSCNVGDEERVFGGNLSDHLPIIADFV